MWQGIHGHDRVVARFRAMLASGRLASTFLFIGPEGIGKRAFATALAKGLLCEATGYAELDPCGTCESCRLVDANTHPDLHRVAKPTDRQSLPIELLVGDREHRLREGLCHEIGLKAFRGGRKVAILDDADFLQAEAANCLLKTLEEPPPESILVLIGTSLSRQLPTIRSRCQTVHFGPLTDDQVASILLDLPITSDARWANRLAGVSAGSPGRAIKLSDERLEELRRAFLEVLAADRFDPFELAQLAESSMEAAGSNSQARRSCLREAVELALQFFRQRLRTAAEVVGRGDSESADAAGRAIRRQPNVETAADLVDRCLVALEQIDRNAHMRTVLDCWLDDLCRIANGRTPAFRR